MADWYRETEKLIASYWYMKDRITRLEATEAAILGSLGTLTTELNVVRMVPSCTAKYGVRPPGAPGQNNDLSDLMAEIETQVDKLAAEIAAKMKRLASIRTRLQRAREMVAPIEVVMARLSEDERKVTEYRYVYRWSNYAIGTQLHCSEFRVRYMKDQIVKKAARWLGKIS